MIIDFHTHTFPERIAAGAIAHIQSLAATAAFTDGTAPGLSTASAKAGIDLSIVLPVATNPLKLGSMNRAILDNPRQGNLLYFGAIHPLAPDWQEQLTALARAGVKGIKLHPHYQGIDVTAPETLRVMARAAELGLITVLHAGTEIAYPDQPRATPEMLSRVLKSLPGAKVVLAHMGSWRSWDRVLDDLGPTGAWFDTALSLGAITPLPGAPYCPEELRLLSSEAFATLVRNLGPERILFGSDSPWGCQSTDIANIRALPLSDAEKTAILSGNACCLLGM